MDKDKKQIYENILDLLNVFSSKFKEHEKKLYEAEQAEQVEAAKRIRTVDRTPDQIKEEDAKQEKKKTSVVSKVIGSLLFGLFAFLPAIIKVIRDNIQFIKSLPEKIMAWVSDTGKYITNAIKENVVEPLKQFIFVNFLGILDALKEQMTDGFERLFFWPLTILNKTKQFFIESKISVYELLKSVVSNKLVTKYLGIGQAQADALQKKIDDSYKELQVLKEEQQIREESLEALDKKDFGSMVEEAQQKRGETYEREQQKGTPAPAVKIPSTPGTVVKIIEVGPGYNILELQDGRIEKRTGDRNWRNNNPGNIMYGDYAKSMGAIGTDGRFAIFPTYETGRQAKERLIFEGKNYRDIDLVSAIGRYAPPNENDTRMYQDAALKAVGGENKLMKEYDASQRDAILNTIQRIEGFRVGKIDVVQEPTAIVQKDQAVPATSVASTGSEISSSTQEVQQIKKPRRKRIVTVPAEQQAQSLGAMKPDPQSQNPLQAESNPKNLYKNNLEAA